MALEVKIHDIDMVANDRDLNYDEIASRKSIQIELWS